jgi:methyl-accepting chemotaxis protein
LKRGKKIGAPKMNFLKNLKIKSKLRIPIIFLLILLVVFIYLYFNIDSIVKSELADKTAITEAGRKIRTLSLTIMDYLNLEVSYDQLNADYRELLQLAETEGVFGDNKKEELIGLEAEFKKTETILKENLQLENQVIELTDSYVRQTDEFLGREANTTVGANPGIISRVSNLGQKVFNIKVLFLKTKQQWENGSKLMEFLDQVGKDAENEGQRLANTSFAQLPQKAKEIVGKTKEITVKFIENSKTVNQSQETVVKVNNGLLEQIYQVESGKINTIVTAIKNVFYILVIVIAAIILLTIVLSYAISKLITTPIRAMIDRAYELAVDDVDMTKRLEVDCKDEIGELSGWFNKFLERLQQLIRKVKNCSHEVFSATKEITTGSEDLANRTNEQAASITETSSTLEKIMETIRQNTENSAEADMMLVDFNQEIQDKSSLIDNVTSTMTEIYDSSKQIDNIIKVINDISFQTNLLALNAAVEAARAGEAGRGFAVVAAEVRNLARKTAESSKSIQDIVLRNVESTQKGMELVKDTSEFFGEIVGVMGEIVQKVSDITTVSREQSANIEQITQTIARMNQVGNRNAALVGELTETGKKVKDNAVELQDLVTQFKIDEAVTPPSKEIRKIKKKEPKIKTKPSPTPQKKKKDKEKEVEKELVSEETATSTSTEDDFFGSTNDEGFEEF